MFWWLYSHLYQWKPWASAYQMIMNRSQYLATWASTNHVLVRVFTTAKHLRKKVYTISSGAWLDSHVLGVETHLVHDVTISWILHLRRATSRLLTLLLGTPSVGKAGRGVLCVRALRQQTWRQGTKQRQLSEKLRCWYTYMTWTLEVHGTPMLI